MRTLDFPIRPTIFGLLLGCMHTVGCVTHAVEFFLPLHFVYYVRIKHVNLNVEGVRDGRCIGQLDEETKGGEDTEKLKPMLHF